MDFAWRPNFGAKFSVDCSAPVINRRRSAASGLNS
jgi:hypothetical protein